MSPTNQPHLTRVEAVRIAGKSPVDRGRARGALLRERIHATARGDAELFGSLGISGADQREAAVASLAAAGFAEHGMPGKIGKNAAGVGVHLNILKHRDDAPGGVPVHSVLTRVLTEATSVEAGIVIIRSAATT